MKSEKEKLKDSIERKYEFYENMYLSGTSIEVVQAMERQIQRMIDEYNSMK